MQDVSQEGSVKVPTEPTESAGPVEPQTERPPELLSFASPAEASLWRQVYVSAFASARKALFMGNLEGQRRSLPAIIATVRAGASEEADAAVLAYRSRCQERGEAVRMLRNAATAVKSVLNDMLHGYVDRGSDAPHLRGDLVVACNDIEQALLVIDPSHPAPEETI